MVKLLDVPTLEVSKFLADSSNGKAAKLQELASSICNALEDYPHFVVVNGYQAVGDRTNLINLSQAICSLNSDHSDKSNISQEQEHISFTKVRIDRSKDTFTRGVTNYSRTHLPLTPHTDSSYQYKPHELIAFQCIVADAQGGESVIIPVEDILSRLQEREIELLRASVYPFGNDFYPIIFGKAGKEHCRYYKAQIERTAEAENISLSNEYLAAMKSLDDLLDAEDLGSRFYLQPGQIVFIHNTKAFHGRTGISPESDRLLYRVRLHVSRLACKELTDDRKSKNSALTEAHQQIAIALKLRYDGNLAAAFSHYQKAIALAPNEVEILREFGEFLIHIGKLDIAAKIFQRCLEIAPDDYESNLEMSSIAYENENYDRAQAILKQVAQQHPYVFDTQPQAQKPNILRIRSFKDSKYCLVQNHDGTCKSILQGGHFSTQHLLEHENYNLIVLNIFEDDIDESINIPQVDLLLNTIACPDLKRNSLISAARFAERYPSIPLINDPRLVLETTRQGNALRLNTISGVSFPKTEQITWDGASAAAVLEEIFALGFVFPFIIRKVGSQTGSSVALIDRQQAIEDYLQKYPKNQKYYIIQFQDCRNNQQIFNKIRVFFIDGEFYPVANLFNDTWNIHSGDRYSLMQHTPWTQDAEKSFLDDPVSYLGQDNFERLGQIRDLIGLDFFGIDFTIAADGTLFVFEANAAMRHNFDHAGNFPYTEPNLRRISAAFEEMIQNRLKIG